MKITIALSIMFLACSVYAESVPQLQKQITDMKAQIVAMQSEIVSLKSNPVFAIAPYVHFDALAENGLAGPHITFSGVNVHINNGAGQTGSTNSLGNLIIGYDEFPQRTFTSLTRAGSHNLVIGSGHGFQSGAYANIVGGLENVATGQGDFVVGYFNQSIGFCSSVCGGVLNIASGQYSGIVGGQGNRSLGLGSAVLGGYNNQENSWYCTLLGGENTIDNSGQFTVVQ